jgi:hypothetical protein
VYVLLWSGITFAPVLMLWLVMARIPRIRWTVLLVQLGLFGSTVIVLRAVVFDRLEIVVLSMALMLAAVITGRVLERRRLGRGPGWRQRTATALLASWLLLLSYLGYESLRPDGFRPDPQIVLPLPDGLHGDVMPMEGSPCESQACSQLIGVYPRPGQDVEDLFGEVRRHVLDRQWLGCRADGLLDPAEVCIEVSRYDHGVTIELSGRRNRL